MKRIAMIAASCALALSLAGCWNDDKPASSSAKPTPSPAISGSTSGGISGNTSGDMSGSTSSSMSGSTSSSMSGSTSSSMSGSASGSMPHSGSMAASEGMGNSAVTSGSAG